jgi:hypothetical protein
VSGGPRCGGFGSWAADQTRYWHVRSYLNCGCAKTGVVTPASGHNKTFVPHRKGTAAIAAQGNVSPPEEAPEGALPSSLLAPEIARLPVQERKPKGGGLAVLVILELCEGNRQRT